ncbi:hypothetical protein V5O48_007795 [Marasmius crinis-equi]|uniref:Uncharacterized protein n=1 Tax=Marasmius crinis-equi TaxID=585013 RepID=A0ABR3FFP1_9AGAR
MRKDDDADSIPPLFDVSDTEDDASDEEEAVSAQLQPQPRTQPHPYEDEGVPRDEDGMPALFDVSGFFPHLTTALVSKDRTGGQIPEGKKGPSTLKQASQDRGII